MLPNHIISINRREIFPTNLLCLEEMKRELKDIDVDFELDAQPHEIEELYNYLIMKNNMTHYKNIFSKFKLPVLRSSDFPIVSNQSICIFKMQDAAKILESDEKIPEKLYLLSYLCMLILWNSKTRGSQLLILHITMPYRLTL